MNADDAVTYVRAKLADWATLPARISAQLARAQRLQAAAAQQGKMSLAAEASSAGGILSALGSAVRSTTDKLVSFLRDLTGEGIPVAPVKLTGPYCSDWARSHPELYTCAGEDTLGAEAPRILAGRFVRPGGIPARVGLALRPRRRVASRPVPILRYPGGGPTISPFYGPELHGELGAVPVVLGVVALALAAAMAAAYKALELQEKRLDLVERGILPASAIEPDGGSTFGGEVGKKVGAALPWIAGGLAAYLLLPRILKSFRGSPA